MPPIPTYNPSKDIPALTGKVIFVTGGTAGLGRGTAMALAEHDPAEIIISGRNKKSADAVIAAGQKLNAQVKWTFIPCDLSSLASVREAAELFLTQGPARLDVLMCNAGIMGTAAGVTTDGYEGQFATNHLGHALLMQKLMPRLEATPGARIVSLSSIAYKQAPGSGIDFPTLKTAQRSLGGFPFEPMVVWNRYGQSKLANLLYAKALAKHQPTVTSVAVHPGIIRTGLFGGMSTAAKPAGFIISTFAHTTPVEQGHYNQTWAASCAPEELENGAYYEPVATKVTPSTKQARDDDLAERLWQWTQEELESHL